MFKIQKKTAVIISCVFLLVVSPGLEAKIPRDIAPFFSPPAQFRNDFGKYKSPLIFNSGRLVRTKTDWLKRRQEILSTWTRIMGPWPKLIAKPEIKYLSRAKRHNFLQYKIQVEIAPGRQMVDSYLLVPQHIQGKLPAVVVVYYDAQTAIGMGKQQRDFALQLTKRNFVTLSIGTPDFCSLEPPYRPKLPPDRPLLQPLSALAYVAANCYNALATLNYVDSNRIGIVGHSYGGKWAMFASCLYDKFACAVWSDPGIVFDETRPNVNYWDPWYLGLDNTDSEKRDIPGPIFPRTGAYKTLVEGGHDLHELHALMAPRPFLVSGGAEDTIRHWQALNHTITINNILGYRNRVAMTNRKHHSPTPESNQQVYLFFSYFLQPPAATAKPSD